MDKKDRYDNYKYFRGLNSWEIGANDNSGRKIVVNDGPLGLRKPIVNDFDNQNQIMKTVCLLSPSSLACTFSKDVCYRNGELLALDCLSKKTDVLLAPGVNIKRSALCGRNFEYFSEDPFLTGVLASAYINGLQDNKTSACVKHYAANNQEVYRLTNSSEMSLRALNEIYLYQFNYIIKHANPDLLMTSYNRINGVYVNESNYLIKKKLRGEFNYKGLIISDWTAVVNKAQTIATGLDVEMPISRRTFESIDEGYNNIFNDEDILARKKEIISCIDKIRGVKKPDINYNFDQVHNKAIELSKETFVLLKNNNNYLPFSKTQKILVIGELAKKPRFVGGGSAWVNTNKTISFLDALKENGCEFDYIEGYEKDKYTLDEDKILKTIYDYSQILVFVGQYEQDESEGWDRENILIRKEQNQLLSFLNKNHIKYAGVVVTGSVIDISSLKESSQAIIVGYISGEGMYEALALTILGDNNPSGRLPETWIKSLKANPIYEDIKKHDVYYSYYDEDIFVGYRYYDKLLDQSLINYNFGEGMSYSEVAYSDCHLNYKDNKVVIDVNIYNKSKYLTKEVVQIFVGKKQSNIYRPLKELKGFTKVELKPFEKKKVFIEIDVNDLKVYDIESDLMKIETGIYQFYICKNIKEIIDVKEVEIVGEQLQKNLTPQKLERKPYPEKPNMITPVSVVINDEHFKSMIKERHPNLDIVKFFETHGWMLNEPIKNLTYNNEIDIDFELIAKYY